MISACERCAYVLPSGMSTTCAQSWHHYAEAYARLLRRVSSNNNQLRLMCAVRQV